MHRLASKLETQVQNFGRIPKLVKSFLDVQATIRDSPQNSSNLFQECVTTERGASISAFKYFFITFETTERIETTAIIREIFGIFSWNRLDLWPNSFA